MALILALAVVAPSVLVSQDEDYRPPRDFSFGLMGVAMREDLTVYQGGARDAEGEIVIKAQDRLLKWNGEALKTRDDFCRRLYATKPGDIVEVEFSRPVEGKDERETLSARIKLADPRETYSELYTHLDNRKRSYDWRDNDAVTKGGPLREKLRPLIEKHNLERDWDNLIAAHERELDLWDSYENLSSTDLLLSDPLAAHRWIDEATTILSDGGNWIGGLAPLIDRQDNGPKLPDYPDPPEGNEEAQKQWFIQRIEAVLKQFVVVPDGEAAMRVRDQALEPQFRGRGERGFERSASLIDQMRQVNFTPLQPFHALITGKISVLNDIEAWLWDGTGEPPASSLPDGQKLTDFVEGKACCVQTSFGLVGVGGNGQNVWKGGEGAPVLILDWGGDDEYLDCATNQFGQPVSLVFDQEGNDRYRATGKWGAASALLGTAMIVDNAGDDTYECSDWGIGAAFGGVGLVLDAEGNDRYLGGSNSVGCAAYGFGGIVDYDGNDLYDSHSLSIGVGQPGGVGFVLDHSGDDRYRCNGEQPSPYGTEGEWFGGGIGCGFGWRTLACGGVGLVVDVKGNDIYDAGEFGLACGYFMGVGAVRDMEGDDVYHSSRYGLAAGAHAAVGVFMDDVGNDVYEGKTAASMSGAWDIVTTYFHDGGGDDFYRCDGLGLGGAAQNAFAIFWDAGGDDVYRSGRGHRRHAANTIGMAGQAEYAGGRLAKNFGIFMDTGGGDDDYPRDDRRNDTEVVTGKFGIVLDE